MTEINLLPFAYREAQARRQARRFWFWLAVTVLWLAVVVVNLI